MKPIQFRGKETMSYNETKPQMNSYPDEIKWNGVDYVKKEFVNQEVERRIAERMPSDEEQDKWADYCAGNTTSDHNKAVLYKAALSLGATWLRSRLTPQVTPQDTPQVEKTECGYYTSEGRCLPGCMTDSCNHHPNNR